jgi:hypothetical protein
MLVETIDHDQVITVRRAMHKGVAIGHHHLQALIVRWQGELLTRHLHHARRDLHRRELRLRIVVVQELGLRTGAQADQQHPLRETLVAQQQRRHHGARVFQHQLIRPLDTHRALRGGRFEMQGAYAVLLAHLDGKPHDL